MKAILHHSGVTWAAAKLETAHKFPDSGSQRQRLLSGKGQGHRWRGCAGLEAWVAFTVWDGFGANTYSAIWDWRVGLHNFIPWLIITFLPYMAQLSGMPSCQAIRLYSASARRCLFCSSSSACFDINICHNKSSKNIYGQCAIMVWVRSIFSQNLASPKMGDLILKWVHCDPCFPLNHGEGRWQKVLLLSGKQVLPLAGEQ
jgi:hypothetical protein